MSSGFMAQNADVVGEKFVATTCPVELENFKECLGKAQESTDGRESVFHESEIIDFFENNGYLNHLAEADTDDTRLSDLAKSYATLTASFEQKTSLLLGYSFHDCDSHGDVYDEVNGAFWTVDGVWQRTPQGKSIRTK